MRERMQNSLRIQVSGADLSAATRLEFYVHQPPQFYRRYEPKLLSDTELLVTIPYADAMQLLPGGGVAAAGFYGCRRQSPRHSCGAGVHCTSIITPQTDEQILPTADRFLLEDLFIGAIPYYETDNQTGTTVYIGKEGHINGN